MSKIMYMDEEYCGNYPSTSTPTAGIDAAFDSDAHINSEDMSSQDVEDFLADINAQGTPSEYKKLLWSNPSPSSAFTGQTILSDVDLSEYDEFEIEVRNYITGDIYNICRFENASQRQIWVFDTSNFTGSTIPVQLSRIINISSSGMAISNGYSKAYNSTSAPSNNSSICLPIKVYGIKYEKVAPIQVDSSVEVLATNVILHRVGNARMLNIGSATYQTIKSVTLSADDRPSARVESMGMKHAGGMYATIGLLYIETTGKIVCNHFGGYSTAAYSSALVDSDAFIGNAIWSV